MHKPTPDPFDGFFAALLVCFVLGCCAGVAMAIFLFFLLRSR